ncbi:MAG: LysR family transcriptional regulator [Myxococcaceae bacterium]|nr:LysR family transcriptional regulator [Myxococcaceae bacterium]
MFDFDAMATFVTVAQLGSFSKAARALNVPRSTVSQRVARLEEILGVRLLERTTRIVRTTSAGAAYSERCARIISELQEANVQVKDGQVAPRGVLRVATPIVFGQTVLAAVAAAFTRLHPDVEVEIIASERSVNPVEEGFDVAVMLFTPDDATSLISQHLKGGDLWLCASQEYVDEHGAPRVPADVRQHTCLVYGESRDTHWTFRRPGDMRRIQVHGALSINSFSMLHEAARASAGITLLPSSLCEEDVRRDRLVRLLASWALSNKALRVVYPSNRHTSPRVRLFVETLVAACRRDAGLQNGLQEGPRGRAR